MVKFTFVVGGGKLVRARYDEDLPRWLSSSLREIGFVEDKSAAETFDSQGTFKQQHDTGQNLKYLIVYPRLSCAEKSQEEPPKEDELDTSSNEYLILASSLEIFKNLVASKTQSWRQKKRMLKALQDCHEQFKEIEGKLVTGVPLTAKEQAIYDANSGEDSEKISWLQKEIKAMADGGGLTASERDELVDTLKSNLSALNEELEKAKEEKAEVKAKKLDERRTALIERRAAIEKAPVVSHRLRHGEEIRRLRLRLLPLLALEDKGRSMSLTLADLKTLEEKPELEEAIATLEAKSRGWFLTDEEFRAMCAIESEEASRKYKEHVKAQAAKKESKPQSKSLGSAGWATVGSSGARASSGGKARTQSKSSSFAAAFDSDSD